MRTMRPKYQTGATMWTTLTVSLMAALIAYVAFKLSFVYIDHSIVRGSMQEIANQAGFDSMTRSDIKRAISNRMTIDNIRDMPKKFFEVTQDRTGRKSIKIHYDKRVHLFGNISALVEFREVIEPKR